MVERAHAFCTYKAPLCYAKASPGADHVDARCDMLRYTAAFVQVLLSQSSCSHVPQLNILPYAFFSFARRSAAAFFTAASSFLMAGSAGFSFSAA